MEKAMHNEVEQREKIEWLNYWIENAYEEKKKRILILGDSVARGYRPFLNKLVQKEGYVVDLLAMSYSIFDSSLSNEIKHFIDSVGYRYSFIIFNLGAHHGYSMKINESVILQDVYYQKLDSLLQLISEMPGKIITMSGTPERATDIEANNFEIENRNRILEAVSYKNKYSYIDIYSQLYNNKEFPQTDLFHFNDNGYEYIAYELNKALGFQANDFNSNRIDNLKSFLKLLKQAEQVYIYGNGKRGKLLYRYLSFSDIHVMKQYIVSNEYYEKENQWLISLDEIERELDSDDIILVTLEDMDIWKKLEQMKIRYYTLSEKVYSFVHEYITAYMDL